MWQEVRRAKEHPDFDSEVPWQLEELASGREGVYQARTLAQNLEIPEADLIEYVDWSHGSWTYGPEAWDVILPFFDGMAGLMNRRKPADIPGRLYFGWYEADNSFGLMYFEEEV